MASSAILCIDDEPVVLRSLRDQISKFFGDHHLCEIAESVDEAWEVIDELTADDVKIVVIISDWLMPEVKGDEFLIALHQKYPQTVTVLLSGQVDDAAIERIHQNMDLHAYLSKPWQEEELITTIQAGLATLQQ